VENGKDIVFLHEIKSGPASKSYGIQVAKLAGMPIGVVNHARHTLAQLEQEAQSSQQQIDLFEEPAAEEVQSLSPLQEKLLEIDPDQLSPREALDAIYALKKLL
jgi:DNA mismatch repair protein MutS